MEFCLDLLSVYENGIFPYMSGFSKGEQDQRFARYLKFIVFNRELLFGSQLNDIKLEKDVQRLKQLYTDLSLEQKSIKGTFNKELLKQLEV
jgi:hypothetical protein